MAMVDPFIPSAFALNTLTAAINNLPYKPGRIGTLGWFQEQGVATTSLILEEKDGVISIVEPKPRGAPGTPLAADGNRRVRTFLIPHLPQTDAILADSVQGVRAFGTENQAEVLQTRINERLQRMRDNIDYTIEYHRGLAIQGAYVDANGDSASLFTEFGVAQNTLQMHLSPTVAGTSREHHVLLFEAIEAELAGLSYSGVRVLCSSGYWKALLENKDLVDTFKNTPMAATLRSDPLMPFEYMGCVYERYRGTSVAKMADNTAYAVPEGVSGLFLTRFGPANYNETVNTIGLPYYSKGQAMDFGKGWELEAQSNVINICTRPRAIIQLTI
jgi:hypothetical protein